jgi:predicted phage tail protein
VSFELRRTMPAAWVHAGAFQVDLGRNDVHLVGEFLCIRDTMPMHGRPIACQINGEWITRADWWRPVEAGDVIIWVEVAQGGGNSNALRIVAMIALVIVANVYGGALGSALGFTGQTATGVGAGLITLGGTLAINALLPLPKPPGLSGGAGAGSPTYNFGLQGNRARPNEVVPVRYGHELVLVDYAGLPYQEYDENNDQFFCAPLVYGLGVYEILAVLIDDTDIRNFEDVTVIRVGPSQSDFTDSPFPSTTTFDTTAARAVADARIITSREVAGQNFINAGFVGNFTVNPRGTTVDRLYYDVACPAGLGAIQPDGSISTYGVTWQMSARLISDAGQPQGAWFVVGQENITEATTNPIRRSFEYTVPAGRYQTRMRRVTDRADDGLIRNDFIWIGLRARLAVTRGVDRDDLTGICVRIRANEQLSGLSQSSIRVLGRRLLPIYDADTETWSAPTLTRNPAWALADVWKNATYGRGLPDSRVDLESLTELAETWDTRQDRFDFSFDTKLTTDDAAQLVARVGRAKTILRRGSIFSAVRDELQTVPVAAFMPRNMDADSFNLDLTLPTEETADAVVVTYRDNQVWAEKKVWAQIVDGEVIYYDDQDRPDDVDEPTNVEEITFPGIAGHKHALREAVQIAGDSLLLRESATFQTDLDGMLPAYGSLISTAHDVASWGQSGDVVDYDSGSRTVTASEPLVWATGTNYARLVNHTGTPSAAIVATPGATDYEFILATAPGFTPSFDDADRERTRYLFGSLADVQRYAVVRSIQPQGEDQVTLSVVMENAARHTLDADLLPAVGEIQDEPSDGGDYDPGVETSDYIIIVNNIAGFYLPDASEDNRVALYEFRTDGSLYLQVRSLNEYTLANQWIGSQPVSASICALYEMSIRVDHGALGGSSPPADTWLNLGTLRRLEPAAGDYCQMRITIRDVETQTVQDEADLIMFP